MDFFSDHSSDIKVFKHWTLLLHNNQSYLGRTICRLNIYKEKLSDLNEEEYLEFLEIVRQYEKALSFLWQPDLYNYAQLGNVVPHLHFHFIPRYKEKREFEGVDFIDERWGRNYAPAPEKEEDKILNEKIKLTIEKAIKN